MKRLLVLLCACGSSTPHRAHVAGAALSIAADDRMVEAVKAGCFRYFEAFPDLHVALDDLIAEGDRVFLRSTMTGTHDGEYKGIPATGRHVATECAEVFRIADGKFAGYWCLTNVAGLMRQLTDEPAVVNA